MNKIIFLTGPTATGKTLVSLKLSEYLNNHFEIVNFDSLLFYKDLNIGTAKPTLDEMNSVPHHLVSVRSINHPMDASQFVKEADEIINKIFSRNKIPILAGGSGFYLRALVKGMMDSQTTPEEIRIQSEKILKEKGINYFREYLKDNDPESFNNLHENDHYRIVRAYEHHLVTGKKISDDKKKMDEQSPYDFSKNNHPNWDFLNIYLDVEKDEHYEIIKSRAEKMIEQGLIEEVQDLLAQGFSKELKPLQSIGYKETIAFLEGEIPKKEDLIERIFISTRQLAKSQRTFFNKITPKEHFDATRELDSILKRVESFL